MCGNCPFRMLTHVNETKFYRGTELEASSKSVTMDQKLRQSDDNRFIPMTSFAAGGTHEVLPDVFYYTQQIVNVIFVGDPLSGDWVLVDAGMPKGGDKILEVAMERFGNVPPRAIILTHGHFDHVGGIVTLLEEWNVPVYAHPLEFPFLTGKQAYPEPDATVEGGMLAKISSYYPNEPVDISPVLRPLPADQSVPFMPGWKWVHTPGHSPGHVSFFRNSDKTLIAGDAFVTVRTDSFYKTLIQKTEVNGPPRYLTTDWNAAYNSVRTLQSLFPQVAITGHGLAMEGGLLSEGLAVLTADFEEKAVPDHGKYVPKSTQRRSSL